MTTFSMIYLQKRKGINKKSNCAAFNGNSLFSLVSCDGEEVPNTGDNSDEQQGEQLGGENIENNTNNEGAQSHENNAGTNNAPTNEIIITAENWQEYLELKLVEEWGTNGCYISSVLGLKDKYANKKIAYTTTLDVEWSATWVYKKFTCDRDGKTYKIGEIIVDKLSENETEQSSFLTQLLNIQHYANTQSVILIGGETDYYTYVKIIENFEVLNASGTIRFE